MPSKKFKLTALSAGVAAAMGAAPPSMAQQDDALEEIVIQSRTALCLAKKIKQLSRSFMAKNCKLTALSAGVAAAMYSNQLNLFNY